MTLSDILKDRGEIVKYAPKLNINKDDYVWYNTEEDYTSNDGLLTSGMLKRMLETTSFKTKQIEGDTYINIPVKVAMEYSIPNPTSYEEYQDFVEDLCNRARIPRLD